MCRLRNSLVGRYQHTNRKKIRQCYRHFVSFFSSGVASSVQKELCYTVLDDPDIAVNRKWNNGPLHVTVLSVGSGVVNVAIKKSEILASLGYFLRLYIYNMLGINVTLRHSRVTTVPLKSSKYYTF